MNNDPRGTIVRQGNALRIDNAFVEDSSCINNSNGTILISYSGSRTDGFHPDLTAEYKQKYSYYKFFWTECGSVPDPARNVDQCHFFFPHDKKYPASIQCVYDCCAEQDPGDFCDNRPYCGCGCMQWLYLHRKPR